MKKVKIGLRIFCSLFFVVLGYFFIADQKPEIENISHHLEMGEDNTFYIAENKKYLNLIYKIDENGSILNIFQRRNNAIQNKEIITDMCYEKNVYFLVEREKGTNAEEYEVFRINDEWESAQSMGVLQKEITFMISNFTVFEGKIYITGIDTAQKEQIVYALDIAKKNAQFEAELLQKFPVKANRKEADIVQNYYDGTNLYSLTNQGMLYRYQKNSALGEPIEEAKTVSWILDSHTGVLCYSQEENAVLHVNQDNIQTVEENPQHGIIDMTRSLYSGNQAIIYRDENLEKNIRFFMQDKDYEIKSFSYGPEIVLQLYFMGIIFIAGVIISIYVSMMLALWFLKKQRKAALTLAVLTLFLNLSFIASICIWNYWSSRDSLYESRAISTNVYLSEEIKRLENKVNIKEIAFDNFAQSEWFSLTDDSLWDWSIADYAGHKILFEVELIELSESNNKILVSEQNACGKEILGIYSRKILEYLYNGEKGHFAERKRASFEDREYMYVLVKENQNYMWIGRAEIRDIPERTKEIWLKSVVIGILFGGINALLFMWLIFRLLKPLKRMSRAMEMVSIGIYDLKEENYPDNEFGDMWKYLHKMCNALRAREHSSDNVLSYYQRFAPKNFERLLGVESIQDVHIGDQNKVLGSIALISIADPKELYEERKRHAFLQSANQMTEYINKEADKEEGVLLAEGYQFTSFRKLYEGSTSADKVYEFAIDLLHDLYSLKEEQAVMNPCIILHNDSFLCGLSGTDSLVCPYIISESSEVLSSYIGKVGNLGIRLLLTEEIIEKLLQKPTHRFIGHIEKSNRQYHLYEVLNVCQKQEMLSKINYNGSFQQGLQLYFQNHFYEARNCFTEIIKICPSDGVAKWYLFACEFFMEKGIVEAASHDLFGAEHNQ